VPVTTVRPDQPLAEVLELYEREGLGEVPVVADGVLVGTVTRRDVTAHMHFEILKRQTLRAKFVHPDEQERADYVELPQGSALARIPILAEHVDRCMKDAEIRTRFGIHVVNVIRADAERGEIRVVPDGDFMLRAGDELIVIGDEDQLARWRAQASERRP